MTMDVTDKRLKGADLIKEIVKLAKDANASGLYGVLPDTLLVTEDQFVSLLPHEDHMHALQSVDTFTGALKRAKGKLFYTPYNVMEVRVKGLPTFKDVANA